MGRTATKTVEHGKVVPLPRVAEEPEAFSLRILWTPSRWVEDVHGRAELERVARACGLSAEDLDAGKKWVGLSVVERFLEEVHRLAGDDARFVAACGHRIRDAYGPIKYVLWAVSPDQVLANAVRTVRFVSRISRYETLEHTRSRIVVRYYSEQRESRLLCLSRQANGIYLPTIWGMPRAEVEERVCIARGDPYCEYDVRCFAGVRWLPALVGGVLGAGAGLGLAAATLAVPAVALTTALGAAVGYLVELRRVNRLNLRLGAEGQDAIAQLAGDELEAREELHALRQRQAEWVRLLEEQLDERSAAFQAVLSRLQSDREARETELRGFSHDLRNPLAVLVSGIDEILEYEALSDDGRTIAIELKKATESMERLLADLMETAIKGTGAVRMTPERIPTHELADRLRRRLRALAYGKPLRTSAFATREIPEYITADPIVFDRVVDNLLTNAVKYTESGSIVVELTGRPGFLTLKVSDTGQGIPEARMEEIFRPGASTRRAPHSYGVGLSVVVGLLGQMGGSLEVMSREGVGTTFWAHFPVDPPERSEKTPPDLDRIVTIRRMEKRS